MPEEPMNRRGFLRKAARFGALLAVGKALEACVPRVTVKEEELKRFRLQHIASFIDKDPNNCLRSLQDNEYIVSDDVFKAYSRTIQGDDVPAWVMDPIGGYMDYDYLENPELYDKFVGKLKKLGLEEEEINKYVAMFRRKRTIIFRAEAIAQPNFKSKLLHERVHKEFHSLPEDLQNYLLDCAKKFSNDRNYIMFVNRNSEYRGMVAAITQGNPAEFYPYLSQSAFSEQAEKLFQTRFPDAYKIYAQMKFQASIGLF